MALHNRDDLIANGYGGWAGHILRGALEGAGSRVAFDDSEIPGLVAAWLSTPQHPDGPPELAGLRAVMLPVDEAPADGDVLVHTGGEWVSANKVNDSALPVGVKVRLAAPLRPFRAALADRARTPVNIVAVGDSVTEGTGAGLVAAARMSSWPNVLAQLMRARFPTPGEMSPAPGPNFLPPLTTSNVPTGWTQGGGGTWNPSQGYGPTALSAVAGTIGRTLTYVAPVGTTDIDLMYLQGGSAAYTFTVTLDGGAVGGTLGQGTVKDGQVYSMTGLNPATTHTLVITAAGASANIDGICLYAGNKTQGIRVFNAGHHGSNSSQYLPGGAFNWMQNGQSPTVFSGIQSMIPLNPDLVLLGPDYNDFASGGQSASTHQANLAALIAGIRSVLPAKTIPFAVISKYAPGPGWIAGAGGRAWADYVDAHQALADADPHGLHIDLTDTLAPVESAEAVSLSLYADVIHGTPKAYGVIADAVAHALTP